MCVEHADGKKHASAFRLVRDAYGIENSAVTSYCCEAAKQGIMYEDVASGGGTRKENISKLTWAFAVSTNAPDEPAMFIIESQLV
jgi:hypothetical protein